MKQLSAQKRLALEAAIELVLARRGLDVVETEYGKPLGKGLYEFRLRWSASGVQTGERQAPGQGDRQGTSAPHGSPGGRAPQEQVSNALLT